MLHSSSQTFQQKYARHVATVLVNYSLSLDELLDGLKKTIRLSEPRLDYVVVTTIYATRAFHFSESATNSKRQQPTNIDEEREIGSYKKRESSLGIGEDEKKE